MSTPSSDPNAALKQIRRQRRRRFMLRMDILLTLFLAGVLVVMINALSFEHHWRKDFSQSRFYTLSSQSQALVTSLANPITLYAITDREHQAYEDVSRLLREYRAASDHIQVHMVDIHRDFAFAEELAARFDLEDEDMIVVATENHRRFIPLDDVYTETPSGLNDLITIKAFAGESLITSAIQEVSEGKSANVYFLSGHGEHDLESFDPYRGYSGIAKYLARENIVAETLVLGETIEIPRDANALIIAGPTRSYNREEVALLQTYLEASGRIIFLLNALETSGLEALIERWGVALQNDIVVDATRTLTGKELFLTAYETHPITETLQGVTSVMYLPRSILPVQSAEEAIRQNRPVYTPLAMSSENGWAEQNLEENPKKFDPLRDIPGPIPVAAAIEGGIAEGMDLSASPTRIVIFGDSDFISNAGMNGGDVDLFLNSLDWILERDTHMGIRPRTMESITLVLDREDTLHLTLLLAAGFPAIIALLGVCVWLVRRTG